MIKNIRLLKIATILYKILAKHYEQAYYNKIYKILNKFSYNKILFIYKIDT